MKKANKKSAHSPKKAASSAELYQTVEGVISRRNQDGTLVLMRLSDVSSFFKLDRIAALVWHELRDAHSALGLVAHFSKLLPKHAGALGRDIPVFMARLAELELIETVSGKEASSFETAKIQMPDYAFGSIQSFDLEKIETEVLNESIYLDVFAGSDLRLKTDIQPIEGALAKVNALEGVHYKWNGQARKAAARAGRKVAQPRTGLIAQQVCEQMPELVRIDRDTGLLAVNYAKLNAYLVEAVKELSRKVETLEQRVRQLSDGA